MPWYDESMATKKKLTQPKFGFKNIKKLTPKEIKKMLPSGKLQHGSHDLPEEGVCLMEAVAFITGEPHSDHPVCACGALTAVGINFNDSHDGYYGDKLNALVPAIPALVGSNTRSKRVRFKRARRAAQIILGTYLKKRAEGASHIEKILLAELAEVRELKTRKQAKLASDIVGYLESDSDTYGQVSSCIDSLEAFWNSSGIDKSAYEQIISEDLQDLITDVKDQAYFLTEVGYIRS